MSYGLRITDGELTATLTAEPAAVPGYGFCELKYSLIDGELQLTEAAGDTDGAELINARRNNISETCRVQLAGYSSLAQAQALLQLMGQLFQRAERRQETGRGNPVYLEIDVRGDGHWWRSELLAGRVEVLASVLDGYWRERRRLPCLLKWRRRPYWEGDEREVGLSADGPPFFTGGFSFANCDDTTRINHMDVDPTDLGGDLPAPFRLVLLNESGQNLGRILVGLGNLGDTDYVSTFGSVLEGEASLIGATLPAVADPALYSDGEYQRFTWNGVAETLIGRWTLTAAWMAKLIGKHYRLIGRVLAGHTSNMRLRVRLQAGGLTVWEGPEVVLSSARQLQDLGVIDLLPGGVSEDAGALELQLYARYTPGGAITLDLDYLHITPVDGFRRYLPVGTFVLGDGQALVDDGYQGKIYVQNGANQLPGYLAEGSGMLVWPGDSPRFWYMLEQSDGTALPSLLATMQMYYRPRRGGLALDL